MKLPYLEIPKLQDSPVSVQIMNIKHFPVHRHKTSAEVVFCLSGDIVVQAAARKIHLHKGHFYTVDYDDVHCLYSTENNITAIINIDLACSCHYQWNALKSTCFACCSLESEPYQQKYINYIYPLLYSMLYAFSACKEKHELNLNTVTDKLLNLWTSVFMWPYKSDLDEINDEQIRSRMQCILSYIDDNYMNKITLEQVARINHINKAYLSQFMKKTSCAGFKEIIANVRCSNAEALLLNTNKSIQEISALCGFSEAKSFYKWFNHYYKTTPFKHRKMYQNYSSKPDSFYVYAPDEINDFIKTYIVENYTAGLLENSQRKTSKPLQP